MSAISVANHPKAQRTIRQAKGWGGLIPFALVLYVSYSAGVPLADATLRALLAGVVGTVLARVVAVTVWRELVLAELESTRRRMQASREAAMAEAMSGAEPRT